MTDRVNAIIKATAAESDSLYIDLRAAFKGRDYLYDETHYLSSDESPHADERKHVRSADAG